MKNRGETAKMLSRRFEKKKKRAVSARLTRWIGIFNLPLGEKEGRGEEEKAFARPKLRIYVSKGGGRSELGRNEEKRGLVMIKLSNATLTAFKRDIYIYRGTFR